MSDKLRVITDTPAPKLAESENPITQVPWVKSVTDFLKDDSPLMQVIEKIPFLAPLKDMIGGLKNFLEKIGVQLGDLKNEVEQSNLIRTMKNTAENIWDKASEWKWDVSNSVQNAINTFKTGNIEIKWISAEWEKRWNEPNFQKAVQTMCGRLGVNPDHMKLVMWRESGISASAVNQSSNATGLIQFMPNTARWLGTTVEALWKMSPVEQLKYVEKYYEPYKWKLNSPADLYLVTFYPLALQKWNNFVFGSEKSSKYANTVARQNPGIAKFSGGNKITREWFEKYVNSFIA